MSRQTKNLACRKDIEPDVLRQRRDLYAVSIGLTVFYLAGGHFPETGTGFAGFPVKLARPEWILYAAWIGWAYFLLRYWLMAPSVLDRLGDEWGWQARACRSYEKLCEAVGVCHFRDRAEQTEEKARMLRLGYRPTFRKDAKTGQWWVSNGEFRRTYGDGAHSFAGDEPKVVPPTLTHLVYRAKARGFLRMLYRERTFTDYALPYLFAFLPLLLALRRWLE